MASVRIKILYNAFISQYCSFDLTLYHFMYFNFSVIFVIICLPFLLLYIAIFMHFHFLLFFCFAVLLFFYSCNFCLVLFFSIHLILSFTTIAKIIYLIVQTSIQNDHCMAMAPTLQVSLIYHCQK